MYLLNHYRIIEMLRNLMVVTFQGTKQPNDDQKREAGSGNTIHVSSKSQSHHEDGGSYNQAKPSICDTYTVGIEDYCISKLYLFKLGLRLSLEIGTVT